MIILKTKKRLIRILITSMVLSGLQFLTNQVVADPLEASANLENIVLSGTPTGYVFAEATLSYTGVSVANAVSSITVTPTGAGTITVNGAVVATTTASESIALVAGTPSTITVITTEEGKAAKTYTIEVTRVAVSSGSGGGSPTPSAPSAPALKNQSAITLTSSVTTIEWGGSFKVTAFGGESTGALKYSSTGAYCVIDSSGNVIAVAKGICTITSTREADAAYSSVTSNLVTIIVTDNIVPGVAVVEGLIAPTLTISKVVKGVTTLRFKVDTYYAGDRVSVSLGTKKGGKTTYRTLGSATVSSTGVVTYMSKVKFNKGNLVRLKYGSTVIITKTV
jgi:hypothetical protein